MKLPDAVPVSPDLAIELARRHGLRVTSARPLASAGIINTVISLDDRFVLRVPRNHPAHVEQAEVEARAIPLAVAAGVRTPELVAFDDGRDLLPLPYLIVRQVDGRDLEGLRADPGSLEDVWTDVGRDLGRLHHEVSTGDWPRPATPDVDAAGDIAALVRQRVDDGWLSYVEEAWLVAWTEGLAAGLGAPAERRATHGDVQMSNILVGPDGQYRALIDWGCASGKDPVIDFVPVPFAAVPFLLRGHREIAPLPDDGTAERRLLLARIRMLLDVLPRGAAPGTTWGERPVAWLADLLRFFHDPPDDAWRALAP